MSFSFTKSMEKKYGNVVPKNDYRAPKTTYRLFIIFFIDHLFIAFHRYFIFFIGSSAFNIDRFITIDPQNMPMKCSFNISEVKSFFVYYSGRSKRERWGFDEAENG